MRFSIFSNLGILFVFKYFNFFADSFINVFNLEQSSLFINVVLPVGISFYTFQTMSYSIDIYRGELKPTKSLLNFSVFVSFFPQLVAGPIERAKNLLPNVERDREITYKNTSVGIFLILQGFLKKVLIADSFGVIVDAIFNNYEKMSSLDAICGVLFFCIQIYGDFSGYSDIARGISKVLGFELKLNFNFPYLSKSPSEFWARWHISLSSWLRDYLYIPLRR